VRAHTHTWVVHPQLLVVVDCPARVVPRHIPPLGQPQHLEGAEAAGKRVGDGQGAGAEAGKVNSHSRLAKPAWPLPGTGSGDLMGTAPPSSTGKHTPYRHSCPCPYSCAPSLPPCLPPTCLSVSLSPLLRSAVSTRSRNWPTAGRAGRDTKWQAKGQGACW
jgi:hypothetical protein